MNIEKSIATLEVAEEKVILRERIAIVENGEEKSHWFEQRTLQAGDDLSQESDKVKAVCEAVFGSEPTETTSEPIIPTAVTKRQARQQLILMGLLDSVQTAIDSIPDTTQRLLVQSFWDDSIQYERYHPQMLQLAQAVGLNDEQMDQAFIAASQL